MIPFRVFDRENKEMWVVINYHPGDKGGNYLISMESDDDKDGSLKIVSADQVAACRMVDFMDEMAE
jgi:hypothetical protein